MSRALLTSRIGTDGTECSISQSLWEKSVILRLCPTMPRQGGGYLPLCRLALMQAGTHPKLEEDPFESS